MIIDAHQHVWNLTRSPYAWLTGDLAPIDRTIEFAEARERFRKAGIDATILVQSDDTDADTNYMLEVQRQAPEVVGVVGYVPLADADRTAERLVELRAHEAFCGIRNLIHDLPDPDWLLRDDVARGLAILEGEGVPFDLVAVLPRHLEVLLELGERHPGLRVVVDHLAKPPIGLDDREPWQRLIADVAKNPNVYAKVSGLYAHGEDPAAWSVDLMHPFIDHAVNVFGFNRLMYGGDWPVSMLAGDYHRVWNGVNEVFRGISADEHSRLFGGTASDFYRLSENLLQHARGAQNGNS